MKHWRRKIKNATEEELQQIMRMIEQRYAADFPDWDMHYLALHKDPVQREKEIALLKEMVNRHKCG